jgi:hypothetical protein
LPVTIRKFHGFTSLYGVESWGLLFDRTIIQPLHNFPW